MHNINITVRNKVAVNPAQDRYVCGNSDYVVHFDFDAEWDAHEVKTARFIKEDGTYVDQVFMGNDCPVPVISDTYKLQVGVFAGNLSTTTAAYVPCKKSILCGNGSPAAPEDDVYHQIMQRIDDDRNTFIVTYGANGELDRTYSEIRAAAMAGMSCFLVRKDGSSDDGIVYAYAGFTRSVSPNVSGTQMTFIGPMVYDGSKLSYNVAYVATNNKGYLAGYSRGNAMPEPDDKSATSYLRWNGTKWVAATIADLKADLGLT